ncbi:Hypothetical predicted protein [Olea europaea subsp. europaea]|uniref:Uncharacterized protein n=1 Tax=Olea europaea subsp. europaea TaxID=158383 RepID=A0A8S0R4M1_OLEEU|nr:Hypothetical predicted protein [Olea europaea subsp. europaea]
MESFLQKEENPKKADPTIDAKGYQVRSMVHIGENECGEIVVRFWRWKQRLPRGKHNLEEEPDRKEKEVVVTSSEPTLNFEIPPKIEEIELSKEDWNHKEELGKAGAQNRRLEMPISKVTPFKSPEISRNLSKPSIVWSQSSNSMSPTTLAAHTSKDE